MTSWLRRSAVLLLAALGLLLASGESRAQLANGSFATNGGTGQLTVNTTLSGWTAGGKEGNFGSQTTPPVFVFSPGTSTTLSTSGANGDAFMGNVKFYNVTNPPTAGVVIAADGDPAWLGSLGQTVSGLSIGTPYSLQFNWAGAQQQGFSGATTERWTVAFGGSTQQTSIVNTPSQGFAGWQSANLTFTPTATSQLLTFTATGTPGGQPPWLLLNNVTLAPVPEPSSMLLLGGSALAVVGRTLRKRWTTAAAPTA